MIQASTFLGQFSSKSKYVFSPTDENAQHTTAKTKK